MSSTLFLVLSSHRVVNNQIKLCELISCWKPFLEKMHMKKNTQRDSQNQRLWQVVGLRNLLKNQWCRFVIPLLNLVSWKLVFICSIPTNAWILWYRNISEQSVIFFLWNYIIHASVKQAHQNPDLSLPIIRGSGIWNRSNIICLILA